jgi:hypothetical protein
MSHIMFVFSINGKNFNKKDFLRFSGKLSHFQNTGIFSFKIDMLHIYLRININLYNNIRYIKI